jgi:hypothetical protein
MKHWMMLGLVLLAAGCKTTLDDGYEPRKLGASDSERRAFYASPFSPESRVPPGERSQSSGEVGHGYTTHNK